MKFAHAKQQELRNRLRTSVAMIADNKCEIVGPISNPDIGPLFALEPHADRQLQSVHSTRLMGASRLGERNSFAFESPHSACSSTWSVQVGMSAEGILYI
jgi:hypothetical protein